MNRNLIHALIVSMVALCLVACAKEEELAPAAPDVTPPRVVSTTPLNGSKDVDPGLTEISVLFNEKMTDGSWSWAYDNESMFPQTTGSPYYDEAKTLNRLPVKLEPNKDYEIWVNGAKFKGFKDEAGNSSFPFKFTFKTK